MHGSMRIFHAFSTLFTTLQQRVRVCSTTGSREYWMIFRGLAFLAVVWFGSFPILFRQYKLFRRHKGRLRKRENLLTGNGGQGVGEEPNHATTRSRSSRNHSNSVWHWHQRPYHYEPMRERLLKRLRSPWNRFQGIDSASLRSLAGRYDNPKFLLGS